MRSKTVMVTLGLMLFLATAGCLNKSTGGGGGGAPPTDETIVGKWILKSSRSNGTMTMNLNFGGFIIDTTLTWDTTGHYSNPNNYIDVRSNHQYVVHMEDTSNLAPSVGGTGISTGPSMISDSDSGTWALSGSNLQAISFVSNDTANLTASLTGVRLTLKGDTTFSSTQLSGTVHETSVFEK